MYVSMPDEAGNISQEEEVITYFKINRNPTIHKT